MFEKKEKREKMNIDSFVDAIISRNRDKDTKFEVRHLVFIASMAAVPFVFLIAFLINKLFISAVAAGCICVFSVMIDFINLIDMLHVSDNMKPVMRYFLDSRIMMAVVLSVVVSCEGIFA